MPPGAKRCLVFFQCWRKFWLLPNLKMFGTKQKIPRIAETTVRGIFAALVVLTNLWWYETNQNILSCVIPSHSFDGVFYFLTISADGILRPERVRRHLGECGFVRFHTPVERQSQTLHCRADEQPRAKPCHAYRAGSVFRCSIYFRDGLMTNRRHRRHGVHRHLNYLR